MLGAALNRMAADVARTEHHLRLRADHDPLTGLANRARFAEAASGAVLAARDGSRDELVAVLLVALDGFKAVNDRLGHAAGDRVLCDAAARLPDATRGSDLVARLGVTSSPCCCRTCAPNATPTSSPSECWRA